MSICFRNLLLTLSSVDPAGYFKFGAEVLKSEVVFVFPAVSQGSILGIGEDCGEEGGETPGGPIEELEVEVAIGVRKSRRRCARKVVGV